MPEAASNAKKHLIHFKPDMAFEPSCCDTFIGHDRDMLLRREGGCLNREGLSKSTRDAMAFR